MQLTLNLKIQVGELCRLKTGGGGTQFPRVPPYFDPCPPVFSAPEGGDSVRIL